MSIKDNNYPSGLKGMERYYRVVNLTGSTIPDCACCMVIGTIPAYGKLSVGLAVADGTIHCRCIIGIATKEIPHRTEGLITEFGLVGMDTRGQSGETWSNGDTLWISPNRPGGLTNIEPTAPNLKIPMGLVIDAAEDGAFFVRPLHGIALDDLHNVQITNPQNGDIIIYNSTTGRWENSQP